MDGPKNAESLPAFYKQTLGPLVDKLVREENKKMTIQSKIGSVSSKFHREGVYTIQLNYFSEACEWLEYTFQVIRGSDIGYVKREIHDKLPYMRNFAQGHKNMIVPDDTMQALPRNLFPFAPIVTPAAEFMLRPPSFIPTNPLAPHRIQPMLPPYDLGYMNNDAFFAQGPMVYPTSPQMFPSSTPSSPTSLNPVGRPGLITTVKPRKTRDNAPPILAAEPGFHQPEGHMWTTFTPKSQFAGVQSFTNLVRYAPYTDCARAAIPPPKPLPGPTHMQTNTWRKNNPLREEGRVTPRAMLLPTRVVTATVTSSSSPEDVIRVDSPGDLIIVDSLVDEDQTQSLENAPTGN